MTRALSSKRNLPPCCERHVTQIGVLSPTVCPTCERTLMVRDRRWRVETPSRSTVVRCDDCNTRIEDGEMYYEVLTARRVAGGPPPMYAAKRVMCESCDRDHDDGCPCVGTPDQEECPHA